MYDIDELERQWVRYRRKRLIRRTLLGMGVLLLVGAPILYVTFKRPTMESVAGPTRSVEHNETNHQGMEQTPALAKVSTTSSTTVGGAPTAVPLAPTRSETKEPSLPDKRKKPKMLITLTDRNAPAAAGPQSGAEKKIRMEMVDTKNSQVVREIEARFPMTRDYDDAMYLAKYYYRKKKYRKAEYWAMQANTIDSTQEGSWIIFGKAKVKQGHRADALRVLQAYYDRSGSMRVKMLIDKIRKGRSF